MDRRILPYVRDYSPSAMKIYLWLTLRAEWIGERKGIVEFTYGQAVEGLNLTSKTLTKGIRELSLGHVRVPGITGEYAPPLISILSRARTKGQLNRVKILNNIEGKFPNTEAWGSEGVFTEG